MSNTLLNFSNELASAVARASSSVVAVHGRPRLSSSGIVWRTGLIVTTDSGLRRDEDIRITLPDGAIVAAALRGRDASTDLAVLACETGAATPAIFSKSQARAGEAVLTVGRTADTGPIATLGIVSGVAGEWQSWRGGKLDEFVRLDASVYPTSTGGAVVNGEGELIGIVAGGLSRSSVLAITKRTIDRVAEALAAKGHVARGYIGIGLQTVAIPQALRQQLKLEQETGAMALSVQENGPGARAGMMMGDVVISVNGQPITGPEALHAALDPGTVGKELPVDVLRGGALQRLSVTIAERPRKTAA